MRAAVLVGPERVEIEHRPVPDPKPGEVRVRLDGCGICGSNLPVWEGRPWFSYPQSPGAPGHEGWGVVDAIGEDVSDFAEGDRVSMISFNAFAEYDRAPAESLIRLPDTTGELPCPGEPYGCAMNVFARSGIASGQTVAIVGIGFLGALLTNLASRAGAKVIALSRRPFALETARRLGAAATVAMEDRRAVLEFVSGLTGGAGCEVVIEATGLQWPLDVAGELTTERGRLVIAGYHQDGPRRVNLQLWNWKGLDVINAHERDPAKYVEGTRAAFARIREGTLTPASLFTHRYALADLGDGFAAMRERPERFLKAYVDLWG